jgi:hypothetical protein
MAIPLMAALAQTREPEPVAQVGSNITKHALQQLLSAVFPAIGYCASPW